MRRWWGPGATGFGHRPVAEDETGLGWVGDIGLGQVSAPGR
ncbi:hypothetical protein [Demequina rhizosphaerae]|nr:hypothetical protein [Demequina rhizosphaerae]